jgi:hypothetical protein
MKSLQLTDSCCAYFVEKPSFRPWARMPGRAIDALRALSERAASGRCSAMHFKRPLPPFPPASASTTSPFAADSAQLQLARTRHEHLTDLAVGDDPAS